MLHELSQAFKFSWMEIAPTPNSFVCILCSRESYHRAFQLDKKGNAQYLVWCMACHAGHCALQGKPKSKTRRGKCRVID